ncbi:MAG: hypothetical protein LBG28_08250 [Tannerella sp.]|jgi:hypothetical protein|nr:hypothetical protein [Tannerella sp.]
MQKKLFVSTLPYLLIFLACLLVYIPVVTFDFQRGWDDGWMVKNHYTILGFTPENLKAVFTEFHVAQYGPVNEIIYMAIFSIFGYDPVAYHLYPLLLHILNSCMVLLLIRKVIDGRTDATTAHNVAFLTAALFAVHPLQVESIAWISASKIPLYTFFVLLAMLAYIRYIRTGKIFFYVIAFLLFVCAFGSKEQCIVLPATLFLLDWALGRTSFACGEKPEDSSVAKESWSYLVLEKLPFILFALFGGLVTYANQSAGVIERWAGYSFGQRMVFACYSIVEYFGKMALPVNLLHLYPFPIAPGKALPVHFFVYPFIIAATVIFLVKIIKRRHWPVVFGLLFFLINMALMLHVISMSRFSVIADRYVYLGCTGIFFVVTWYGVLWLRKKTDATRKWTIVAAVCYLFYLGIYAHFRTYVWKDSGTLKKEFRELIDEDLLKQNRIQNHEDQ